MSAHPLINLVILCDLFTVVLIAHYAFNGAIEKFNIVARVGIIFVAVGVLCQALSSLHFLAFGTVSILSPVWALKDVGIFLGVLGQSHEKFWEGKDVEL